MLISGEKDYQKEQIPFQLQIPPDILDPKTQQHAVQDGLESKLSAAGSLISAVAVGTGNTKWKIRAQLDVPKADQDIQLYVAQGNQPDGVV